MKYHSLSFIVLFFCFLATSFLFPLLFKVMISFSLFSISLLYQPTHCLPSSPILAKFTSLFPNSSTVDSNIHHLFIPQAYYHNFLCPLHHLFTGFPSVSLTPTYLPLLGPMTINLLSSFPCRRPKSHIPHLLLEHRTLNLNQKLIPQYPQDSHQCSFFSLQSLLHACNDLQTNLLFVSLFPDSTHHILLPDSKPLYPFNLSSFISGHFP